MELRMILFNFDTNRSFFELERGRRPWDILLTASRGSFSVYFPERGEQHLFLPFEIAHIPPNTEFVRRVVEPIDFYQFTFQRTGKDRLFDSLKGGKLSISESRSRLILEDAERIALLPDAIELAQYLVEQMVIGQYLVSRGGLSPTHYISPEIEQTIRYMNDHLAEKIPLEQLADRMHLSHNGLIWKFKKEIAMTPSEYLIAIRMRHAQQLLLDGRRSISEIAERCGYANAYYFSNAFCKCVGCRPTEFRKKYLP